MAAPAGKPMIRPATDTPGALDETSVRRRFDRAAATFNDAQFVHRHAAAGIFERMLPMLLDPRTIVDAGAATGSASRELAKRFPRGHVVSLDWSRPMLTKIQRKRSWFARNSALQADAMALPFGDGSIDLMFSNMLLPWIDRPDGFFTGVNRVLRKDGLFIFSALGPDSLLELRKAWAKVDDDPHVNAFLDMHDVGDALMRSGLREPVLDVEFLTVTYPNSKALLADLTRAGARNSLRQRRHTLTGIERFRKMSAGLEAGVPLTCRLEIVFGHAFGGGPRQQPGEFRVDAGRIGHRRR